MTLKFVGYLQSTVCVTLFKYEKNLKCEKESNGLKLAKVAKKYSWLNFWCSTRYQSITQHLLGCYVGWFLVWKNNHYQLMMLVYDDLNEVIDCTQHDSKDHYFMSIQLLA